jgi:hypothetical protein
MDICHIATVSLPVGGLREYSAWFDLLMSWSVPDKLEKMALTPIPGYLLQRTWSMV